MKGFSKEALKLKEAGWSTLKSQNANWRPTQFPSEVLKGGLLTPNGTFYPPEVIKDCWKFKSLSKTQKAKNTCLKKYGVDNVSKLEKNKKTKKEKLSFTTKKFIQKAKQVHGDRYDYSKVIYISNHKKVIIGCKICGKYFEQEANNHLQGHNCPYCTKHFLISKEDFLKEARQKHGNKYDYSLVDYQKSSDKIKIICPIHGVFNQVLKTHLCGSGCPVCKESRGEERIRILLETKGFILNKTYFRNQKFSELGNLSYDFYIPSKKLLVEFNGRQHYEFNKHFQRDLHEFHKQLHHDWLKRKYAKEHQIKLLTISYKDYKLIEEKLIKELK